LTSQPGPKLRRRASTYAGKRVVELADRAEASVDGEVDDFAVGRREEALGVGDPKLRDVLDDGHVKGLAEEGHGVFGMQTDVFGDVGWGNLFGVALRDE